MYILNATQDQLDEWYKANKPTYEYLFYKKYIINISKFGDYYYFAKTEELEKALEEAPFWLKIFNKIRNE